MITIVSHFFVTRNVAIFYPIYSLCFHSIIFDDEKHNIHAINTIVVIKKVGKRKNEDVESLRNII